MTEFVSLASSGRSAMRWRLRAATAIAHERMHAHAGFGAAAAGTIEVADYRRLLVAPLWLSSAIRRCRALGRGRLPDRSRYERAALARRCSSPTCKRIGFDPNAAATLPLWRPSVRLVSKGSLLGALYVLEGSTLGGVQIARALKDRVGDGLGKALLFFVGRGERQGAMWRELARGT